MDIPDITQLGFKTPYDDLMPVADDSKGKVLIQIMRIYLALCDGILTPSEASDIIRRLSHHPWFRAHPINSRFLPISETIKQRLLESIRTLRKYNLTTADAIQSAINFVFMVVDAPMTEIDERVLSYFTRYPTASLSKAGRDLNYTTRTVQRAIKRLQERQFLRFSCLLDTTAFGINSFILFFRLKQGVSWDEVEYGLAEFPFTKGLLKTTMTNSGYATFLFPGGPERVRAFRKSIVHLKGHIFSTVHLHSQIGMARDTNFFLFKDGSWRFPIEIKSIAESDASELGIDAPHVLWCNGPRSRLTPLDYIIASQLRVNLRITKNDLIQHLHRMGFQMDDAVVSSALARVRKAGVILPSVVFSGVGLATNFCFEIICNESWRDQILSYTPLLPASITYLSNKGIILWLSAPAEHQVEYYQIFRSLADQDGVTSVTPLMAVGPSGSRSMDNIGQFISSARDDWAVEPHSLDLSRYIPF
ncbi:MAG: hypothetical protein ACTSYL_09555 [Candidatus Thorarchaeota archaeon]